MRTPNLIEIQSVSHLTRGQGIAELPGDGPADRAQPGVYVRPQAAIGAEDIGAVGDQQMHEEGGSMWRGPYIAGEPLDDGRG